MQKEDSVYPEKFHGRVADEHKSHLSQKQAVKGSAGGLFVIWMPEDSMHLDAQQRSVNLPDFMGLVWRRQWDKRMRLGVRVGPFGIGGTKKIFHNQDESNRYVPVKTTWAIRPIP